MSAPVRYGDFEDSKSRSRRLHLHLDVPPIGHLAQRKTAEAVAANGAICAHIGVSRPIKSPDAKPSQIARCKLVPADRTRLMYPARARGDHEIMGSVSDRVDQQRHQIAAIRTVAVHEYDDPAFGSRSVGSRRTGAAVAPA